jgi:hypothetical protein
VQTVVSRRLHETMLMLDRQRAMPCEVIGRAAPTEDEQSQCNNRSNGAFHSMEWICRGTRRRKHKGARADRLFGSRHLEFLICAMVACKSVAMAQADSLPGGR